MTAQDIINNAAIEMGALAAGETMPPEESAFALSKLNRMMDNWNTESLFIYGTLLFQATLTANHNPHTIGPASSITNTSLTGNVATYTAANNFQIGNLVTVAGTTNGAGAFNVTGATVVSASATQFTVAITHADIVSAADSGKVALAANGVPDFAVSISGPRPPKILSANLILTDVTPNIFRPLKIVDDDWWMNNPVPDLATQIPYYLWPNYSWPTASLYLWPVPTKAYDIRLDLWSLFSSFALGTTFTLPPGYEDAVTLSLAESLCSTYDKQPSPLLIAAAAAARGRIKSLNSEAPEMACDGAVQSMDSRPRASIANFLSGFFN